MRNMTTSCAVAMCLFVLSLPVPAGQGVVAPAAVPPKAPLGAESRIRLDVVVSDKSGKPVTGLEPQDFTVLDNKRPVKILSFEAVRGARGDTEPIEVILLIDSVNTSYTHVGYERDEIKKFLRQDGGALALPVSIAFLSDSGLTMQGAASRDGNALVAYLDHNESALRTINRSQGFYGADDRTQLCINALQQLVENAAKSPGKKIVICVSPGWPLLSGPQVELTRKNQEQIFSMIVSLSTQLRDSGVTLYCVDPLGPTESQGREFYYESFLKPARKPSEVLMGDLALQVLASQSGGRVLDAGNDVAGKIETCVRDADAYYVLSIDSVPADGPNEYHALEVKIARPHLKAQTRAGYYTQPTL